MHGVRLIDAAERAAREPVRIAAEQAFAAGYERGRAETRAAEGESLSKATAALEAEYERVNAAASATAVELAMTVAREFLRVEVQAGRHDLERMVRETLQASGAGRGRCTVHLNPDDVAALEASSLPRRHPLWRHAQLPLGRHTAPSLQSSSASQAPPGERGGFGLIAPSSPSILAMNAGHSGHAPSSLVGCCRSTTA